MSNRDGAAMVKKAFLKKLGCILISASIILGGWTFAGDSTSGAEPVADEEQEIPEDSDTNTTEIKTEDLLNPGAEEAEVPVEPEEGQNTEQMEPNGTAATVEGTTEEITDSGENEENQGFMGMLKSAAAPMLRSSLLSASNTTSSSTETIIEGNTLVQVSAGVTSYTVPSNITTIAAGALSNSNVDTLIFENGNNIGSIGTQGGWPATGTQIYCSGCTKDTYVVKFFQKYYDRGVEVYFFEPDPVTSHTITIQYLLLDTAGEEVKTVTAYTTSVEDGEVPTYKAPNTFSDGGTSYILQAGPNPAFAAADDDATYTYTYKAGTEPAGNVYSIAVKYLLLDSAGSEVTVVSGTILSVKEGELPSYTPPTTYKYGSATYGLQSGPKPGFVAAKEDTEYIYTYKDGATPVVTKYNINIKYLLKDTADTAGADVKTVTGGTFQVDQGVVPSYTAPSVFADGGALYNLQSGPTPAFVAAIADANYTYIYKASSEPAKDYCTITINYELKDASLKTVEKTVTGNILSVKKGVTPTYTYPASYTDTATNKTYDFASGPTPAFAAATKDATYVYTYKLRTSGGSGGSGSSGGSSSGSSGGSSSGGGAGGQAGTVTPYASTEAQTNMMYKIIQGAGQSVAKDAGSVTITCNGPVEKLLYVLFDGKVLDSSNYSIKSGSTILTLKSEFVKTLSEGDHVVQFQYNDGYALAGLKIAPAGTKTTTTVTYKVAADGSISAGHTKDTTPKTADGFDSRYLLCIAIFLLGAGAIMLSKQRKLEAILAGQDEE